MWWYKCACMMLFHPIEVGTLVKRKRAAIPWPAIALPLGLVALWRVLNVYLVNFTVATVLPRHANLLLEVGIGLLPVLLWTVASYAFMTVMGGESTFRETLAMGALSMLPYVVFTPVLTLLSWGLSYEEKGLYTTLQALLWIWVVVLILVSFKESNNLSFGKALLFVFLIVIVMALILVVALLAFALVCQIVLFFEEVLSEATFYLM